MSEPSQPLESGSRSSSEDPQAHAERGHGRSSSSDDDHFSDALEGEEDIQAQMPGAPAGLAKPEAAGQTANRDVPNLASEMPPHPPSSDPASAKRDAQLSIPGGFDDSDTGEGAGAPQVEDMTREPEEGALTRADLAVANGEISGEHALGGATDETALKGLSRTASSEVQDTPDPDAQGTVDHEQLAEAVDGDAVVKWNEREDKISRIVTVEREKIEQRVGDERTRSMSSSSVRSKSSAGRPGSSGRLGCSGSSVRQRDVGTGEGIDNSAEDTVMEGPESVENTSSVPGDGPPSPTLSTKSARRRRRSSAASRRGRSGSINTQLPPPPEIPPEFQNQDSEAAADGFGDDDFDDFGEAVEGEEFDDFDGFEEAEPAPLDDTQSMGSPDQVAVPPAPTISLLDMEHVENIQDALQGAIESMYPLDDKGHAELESVDGSSFLTERSLSLWSQLVAPPPLQPPNWKISRIRRLFLVSLGVPVDLDEILPAETKQKKLVLPSLHPPRNSTDSRPSTNHSRSQSQSAPKQAQTGKDGGIRPETLDVPSARILCSTSQSALQNFTVDELREHVDKLERVTNIASEVLTYWLKKRDGAVGDKEAFETVIESLVGYARKKRQNG